MFQFRARIGPWHLIYCTLYNNLSSCYPQGKSADRPLDQAFARDGSAVEITSSLILELHRHLDWIHFAIKTADGLMPWHSIRADGLDELLPAFREQLEKNGFVSINASFCETLTLRGNRRRKTHSTATLKYLCSCYADIDYYKLDLRRDEALAAIRDLHSAGTIPFPSVIADSGQGLWLLWFLRDPQNADRAHLGAWSNHIQIYTSIQRAIIERLRHVGCDPQASDAARHIRIHGSLHTGSESIVQWLLQRGNAGRPYAYTLEELAVFFEVATKPPRRAGLPADQVGERKIVPKRRNGSIQRNKNTLAAFIALMERRGGGFDKGCRNRAAYLFALLLKKNGFPMPEALDRVTEMGRRCRPALLPNECQSTVKSVFKKKYWVPGFAKMADLFDITPEEADIMSRYTRTRSPHATGFGANPESPRKVSRREQLQRTRWAEIRRIIDEVGHVPSTRKMQICLTRAGFDVSHVTISSDYAALGFQGLRSAAGAAISDATAQASLDLVA